MKDLHTVSKFCKKFEIRDFQKRGILVCTVNPEKKNTCACVVPGQVRTAKEMTSEIRKEPFKFIYDDGRVIYIKSKSGQVSTASFINDVCLPTEDELDKSFDCTCDKNDIAVANLELRPVKLTLADGSSVTVLAYYFTKDTPAGCVVGASARKRIPDGEASEVAARLVADYRIKQKIAQKCTMPVLVYKNGVPVSKVAYRCIVQVWIYYNPEDNQAGLLCGSQDGEICVMTHPFFRDNLLALLSLENGDRGRIQKHADFLVTPGPSHKSSRIMSNTKKSSR